MTIFKEECKCVRQINFEPSVGNLRTNLLGMRLSVIDNDDFCRSVKKEEDEAEFNPYTKVGASLIYVVPSVKDEDEEQNSSANIVINLLMQLKAFQDKQNTIFRNSNLLKQNIVKQLNAESYNLTSSGIKKQIEKITRDYKNNILRDEEINKAVKIINGSLKKKF